MALNSIIFVPSDHLNKKLDNVANEIAIFLVKNRSNIIMFTDLMRLSTKWSMSDNSYKDKLLKWESGVKRKRRPLAPDKLYFFELVNKYFYSCSNDLELSNLKGLISEKIIQNIISNRKGIEEYDIGYGVIVKINNKSVIYYGESDDKEDGNRRTVDYGMWNGKYGEFGEIKFDPEAFGKKELKYLCKLKEELKKINVNYKLCLISFGEKTLTENLLKRCDFWDTKSNYYVYGLEEIFLLQQAN